MYSLALRILQGRADAEDVLEEPFQRVWQSAPQYSPASGRPFTWIATIVRHRAIEVVRSRARRPTLVSELIHQENPTHRLSPSAAFDAKEIGLLNESEFEAVIMAYFSGMTQEEIATTLGLPLGTIKARIRSGMMNQSAHARTLKRSLPAKSPATVLTEVVTFCPSTTQTKGA